MTGIKIDEVLNGLDDMVDELHHAKELGGLVSADRVWYRLDFWLKALKRELL